MRGSGLAQRPELPPLRRVRVARPVVLVRNRCCAFQRVVEMLVDPVTVCVTVTGEHGSGKTERAIQACDYVRMRHHFDAVLWADMKRAMATTTNSSMWGYDDPCRLVRERARGGVALMSCRP